MSQTVSIYFLKVNNGNIKTVFEIRSKLIIKILERRQWHPSTAFIVNFEQISQIALMYPLLTLNK